jgi:prepilin-type N-terminal cleavage/methylation domain-containing protein
MDRCLMGKIIKQNSGFSLVELLVALVIVGITLLIVTAFLKNSLFMRGDSKGSEMAYLVGQEKLVELNASVKPVASNDTVIYDGQRFIRDWTITLATGGTLLSTATVTVKYQFSGRTKSLKCTGGLN